MTFYKNKIPNIQHEAELIAGDFQPEDRIEFEDLINSACDRYATYTRDAYEIQKIFDKVEKITLFVKACGLP